MTINCQLIFPNRDRPTLGFSHYTLPTEFNCFYDVVINTYLYSTKVRGFIYKTVFRNQMAIKCMLLILQNQEKIGQYIFNRKLRRKHKN